jgi:hypothetical protein
MEIKKICNCRRGILIGLAVFAVIVAAAFWLLFRFGRGGFFQANADSQEWKNFKENTYGLSIDYPAGWLLDTNYDRYAPGLMGVELSNKKCGFNSEKCNAGCIDVTILIGKKNSNEQVSGLFTQLYEDFMMVRDFSAASIVSTLDLNPKKVFKVASDAPTMALTGACAGPFYVFETDSGYFAYVFAGYGADSAGDSKNVEKIIDSISVK